METIEVYRHAFPGHFRALETSNNEVKGDATARAYHNHIIKKLTEDKRAAFLSGDKQQYKAQRNRCQFCRFQKCLQQGMVLAGMYIITFTNYNF